MAPFFPDPEQLEHIASERAPAYSQADPFPHAVIEGLFPDHALQDVLAEFPSPGDETWARFYSANSHKLACFDETEMGPAARHFFAQVHSSTFVTFLEKLTGIDGLIPDPHLHGGGLHLIEPGGRLEIHADFNRHKTLGLARRLNLLVFLNEDWEEEWGGHLELWSRDMSRCERKVLPVFNRTVVFNTTDTSFHGHPHPLACPEGQTRRSLALYYYSQDPAADESAERHSTLYQTRPGQRRSPLRRIAGRVLRRLS